MRNMKPQAIFFDLDETLLSDNASFDESIRRTCAELETAFPKFAFSNLFASYRRQSAAFWVDVGDQVMAGQLDGQSVRREGWRRALLEHGCSDEAAPSQALESYSRHRLETYSLFDDAGSILESLSDKFAIGVVTNGSTDTQWEKVRQLGLDSFCSVVLVSGEVGVVKPDPRIFRIGLDRLDLGADAAWHVGDSLTSDVAGVLSAGLTAVHLNRANNVRPADSAKPDHEIGSLLELPQLLEMRQD